MVAGTRSFTLEDTFLEPQVLDPPPTRHALFIFLLALAAVLHLATAGWGDLYDGLEGQFAGGAREMLSTQQWLVPTNNGVPRLETPPLVYWLIILSYKIFGVTATAARLPIALAMIASIALTFLIGERLAGYWRGFAAGLIHLCFGGAFLLGRFVTPEPVFGAFIAGAIFCAICGYQRRRFRRAWFAGVWLCVSFACLAKGLEGVALSRGRSAFCSRSSSAKRACVFGFLLHWPYLLLFVAGRRSLVHLGAKSFPGISSPGRSAGQTKAACRDGIFLSSTSPGGSRRRFLCCQDCFSRRDEFSGPHEITFADALPLCWMAVGFLPLLLIGDRSGRLIDEYVERVCALGCTDLGTDPPNAPGRRPLLACSCGGRDWRDRFSAAGDSRQHCAFRTFPPETGSCCFLCSRSPGSRCSSSLRSPLYFAARQRARHRRWSSSWPR